MSLNNDSSSKTSEEHFPMKLHRILNEAEDQGFSDCITWMPDGKSFKILDKVKLEKEVMPRYFTSCLFKSLQRNLNMWGFVASHRISGSRTKGGCRYHPLFIKGRPDLCLGMRRVRVKQPGSRAKNNSSSSISSGDEKTQEGKTQKVVVDPPTFSDARTSQQSTLERFAALLQGGNRESLAHHGIGNLPTLMQLAQPEPNILLNCLLGHSFGNIQQPAAPPPSQHTAALHNLSMSTHSPPGNVTINNDGNNNNHNHSNIISTINTLQHLSASLAQQQQQQQRQREELLLLSALHQARNGINNGSNSHTNDPVADAIKLLLGASTSHSTMTMNTTRDSGSTTSSSPMLPGNLQPQQALSSLTTASLPPSNLAGISSPYPQLHDLVSTILKNQPSAKP